MNARGRFPAIRPLSSALLQTAMAEDRFHVADYLRSGDYPCHGAEKNEAEAFVAEVERILNEEGAELITDELLGYLRAMFPSDELEAARTANQFDRLVAFAVLQRALDDARCELEEASFALPSSDDPIFAGRSDLLDRLNKDGLFVLRAEDIRDEFLRSQGVIVHGSHALYPHPMLTPMRELIGELFELVGEPGLTVSMALDPFRLTSVVDVPIRLLEDYWSGIKTTAENLDSLDPHDTGVRAFHAAPQDTPQRVFHPVLGTWFDWERRSRHDANDPVKRLYIREVCPPADRFGVPLSIVFNRELHAERDTAAKAFTHVDGKTCGYETTAYLPSAAHPNAEPGDPTRSRKLWRVDGRVTDQQWCSLVGLHFRGNDLIDEHFAAAFPERA
jgi:hypothetical protein